MSEFELPWEKFVGFSLFTLEEDMVFDKVINQKSGFSTVFQVIDTSAKTREELRKSQNITLINEIFRVDYHLFYNIILSCMFKPDIEDQKASKIIEIIKMKLTTQLKDYGAIEKMEPRSQTALIKKLGSLISERAASQIKYEFFPVKKPQQVESHIVAEPKKETIEPHISGQEVSTRELEVISKPRETVQSSKPQTQKEKMVSTNVEGLLEFIGYKDREREKESSKDEHKVELTKQLLEETKKASIERVLSSVIKGLSNKTGICFVFTGKKGELETLTYGMTERHAEFVLGILSKYPEVIKQTLEMDSEEKTLDAGDGVVILEDSESGMLVSITKNKEEIPIIAKRLKVVKVMIDQFLKSSF
ncbi:MAG: hypothetical protein ACTSUR_08540 [Candidatus Heimdallarchaeaceae archaeon]